MNTTNWTSTPDAVNSTDSAEAASMQNVYAERFAPYTLLAACGFSFNVLSLLAMSRIRQRITVHHTLLRNLATCDMIGSALLWMYYNSPYIFPRFAIRTLWHCLFVGVVLVAPYILSLSASLLSLLMLAMNQYVAICYPIFSTTSVTKRRACVLIAMAWVVSVIGAAAPALLMMLLEHSDRCAITAVRMGVRSLEVCAYALACLIVVIVILYGKIYREVLSYRRRTPRRTNSSTRQRLTNAHCRAKSSPESTEHNYKAFVTTCLLWSTLVVFWLPYMVFHFISAHLDISDVSDMVLYIKFYLIDFLPMLNFVTDPIIYGMRMREVRAGYRRLFARLLPCWVNEPRQRPFITSIRFSGVDTTSI